MNAVSVLKGIDFRKKKNSGYVGIFSYISTRYVNFFEVYVV